MAANLHSPPVQVAEHAAVRVAVLVPVKAFGLAKARLAPALGAAERAALARRLADRVLAAASPLPTFVVCEDDDVVAWARAGGAEVIEHAGGGLNGAVAAGLDRLCDRGYGRVVVAHADLPRARPSSLPAVAAFGGVTLVPDRHDDGTNVACIPTGAGFRVAYGPGSFHRHAAEALRIGVGLRVVRHPDLGWDVDTPADLPTEGATP